MAVARRCVRQRRDHAAQRDQRHPPHARTVRRRERFLAALHDLAELRIAAGEYEIAIDLAGRGLEHDRLREPLYRVLMRAQAHAGDVAGALRSYERYRRILDAELGAAPSSQTQILHTAILRGEEQGSRDKGTRAQGHKEKESHNMTSPIPLAPLPPTSHSAPFVGRVAE